jgi:hypothetical protein
MLLLYIWLGISTLTSLAAFWFLYIWGWGDASWDDPIIHPGVSDDLWHTRRRFAFYLVCGIATLGNPVALVLFALKIGRKAFRAGVAKGAPHKPARWYPEGR